MHLITQGIGSTSKKISLRNTEKITCRTALIPQLLMPVGVVILISATRLIAKDPDEQWVAIFPLLMAIGFVIATIHFWTLKIVATTTSIEYKSAILPVRKIDLTKPFEFEFFPFNSELKIRQGRVKLTINHYFDGHRDLLEWIVMVDYLKNHANHHPSPNKEESLALLSLPLETQKEFTKGACPACEIINFFNVSWAQEIQAKENLTSPIRKIQEIARLIEKLDENEVKCFEPEALDSDRWSHLREIAGFVSQELYPSKERQPSEAP